MIAFERLGGVPRRVRYDNLKAAVVRVLAGRERTESDRFTALRSHFGFDAFFCAPGPRAAHEKGGVEGEVGRFRRRHLVPITRVGSLAELNALLEAADRSDDARHFADRLATVGQVVEAERPSLRPLPARALRPHGPAAREGRPQGAHLGARLALLGPRRVRGPITPTPEFKALIDYALEPETEPEVVLIPPKSAEDLSAHS